MLRKRVVPVAVLLTAGALSLAACSTLNALPAPEQAPVEQVANTASEPVFLSGTAKSDNARSKTGDWTQLKAAKAGKLGSVVVNGAGSTLYRFDKDTAKPSKSTCNDNCAKIWPPALVTPGSKVFLAGIEKSAVGIVKRDDGTLQLTIDGWPLYRFMKDLKPGDTFGHRVGGTWFGVTPDGQKALAPNEKPAKEQQQERLRKPATSAILFDGENFSDDEPSQGLAGKGCQNLARPDVTSSFSASGSLKLWTEKDCKGKSLVLNGDVKDLAEVGFDNTVSSIFFG